MKFLLLVLVVAVGLWLILKRGSKSDTAKSDTVRPVHKAATPDVATPMLACARCGVRFPQEEVLRDARQRAFCSQDHLAAGPSEP